MTTEEKQLLLIDLSARLPYGVKCNVNGKVRTLTEIGKYGCRFDGNDAFYGWDSEDIKPFLRTMSSMTETERNFVQRDSWFAAETTLPHSILLINWLNEHHFDYRGWIDIGLAFETSKGMYES